MPRLRAALFVALAVSTAAVGAQRSTPAPAPRAQDELRLHFLDVGTGSCTVIECPGADAPAMLVDCGSRATTPESLSRTGAIEYVTKLLTASVGAPNLVLSHPDADHYNYVADAMARARPAHIWQGGRSADYRSGGFADWLQEQQRNGADIHEGFDSGFDNGRQPLGPHLSCGLAQTYALTVNAGRSRNSQSLVLMIRYLDFSAILTGDATGVTEERALENFEGALEATLLATSHHGADTHDSNSQPWADAVGPAVVVTSAGPWFRHPRCAALDRFEPSGVAALHQISCGNDDGQFTTSLTREAQYVTAASGTVTVTTNGRSPIRLSCSRGGGCDHPIAFEPPSAVFPPVAAPPLGSSVAIAALVPNPPGDDEQHETVTLQNAGNSAVSLADWSLRDRTGLSWKLSGSLAAGASQIVQRQGRPMSLDDDGDEIRLQDQLDRVVSRIVYGAVQEGVSVLPSQSSADVLLDQRGWACLGCIIILSGIAVGLLAWLEWRQRAIRRDVGMDVLRSPSFERLDAGLIQTLINDRTARSRTINPPVVDEVLDRAIALLLRPESGAAPNESVHPADRADLAGLPWLVDRDRAINRLVGLKGGTLVPPGLALSVIFAFSALVLTALVVALVLIPKTWSVGGSWLDEVLTTLSVLVGSSITAGYVAVRRRLGLLLPRLGSQTARGKEAAPVSKAGASQS